MNTLQFCPCSSHLWLLSLTFKSRFWFRMFDHNIQKLQIKSGVEAWSKSIGSIICLRMKVKIRFLTFILAVQWSGWGGSIMEVKQRWRWEGNAGEHTWVVAFSPIQTLKHISKYGCIHYCYLTSRDPVPRREIFGIVYNLFPTQRRCLSVCVCVWSSVWWRSWRARR